MKLRTFANEVEMDLGVDTYKVICYDQSMINIQFLNIQYNLSSMEEH